MNWTRNKFRWLVVCIALVLVATLVGCTGGGSDSKWKDGSYTAEADGNNGPVKLTVEIKSGKIANIEVVEHKETTGICEVAFERVPKAIVEKQTWDVDTVSGATNSSTAIKEAVKSALEQAENK